MTRNRHITRGFAALLLASLITLGGCAMTEDSKIEQYQREAQTIAGELVAVVPGNTEVLPWDSSLGTGGGTPDAEVWWQVSQAMNTAEGMIDGASRAGEAIAERLRTDGWDGAQLDRSDATRAVYGFNRDDEAGDGWYVELRYRLGENGRGVDFIVVSPTTPKP
ncbi:MAG TPA: hypothetical protein PKH61_01030 [Microbacteriaceae bacterium]|jgi:hypothetical protein|nr:hypothetical protein [Microbacteriaceae bacterium]